MTVYLLQGKGQGSWMQHCIIILNSTRWVEKYDTTLLNQPLTMNFS
jgi:hypothetical protein